MKNSKNKIKLLSFIDLIKLNNQVIEEYGNDVCIESISFQDDDGIFERGKDTGYVSSFDVTGFNIRGQFDGFRFEAKFAKKPDTSTGWRYNDFKLDDYFQKMSEFKYFNKGEE